MNFSERFLSLNKNLQDLRKAVIGIEDNPELKEVLVMVLKIGNYLNQGTNKGNSISFNISVLPNLKGSKALGQHSKSTMLDFLLNSILTKKPDVAQFALKLEDCAEASKLDLEIVKNKIKTITDSQNTIRVALEEKTRGLDSDRNLQMPIMM